MTAKISAFARGYHSEKNTVKIFDDYLANRILSDEEREQISFHMSEGIKFFNNEFEGTNKEALKWIVDNQLSPSPLCRASWAEGSLKTAVKIGTKQYIIIGAGFDTFAYRQPDWAKNIQIFELDHPLMSADKINRVEKIFETIPNNLTFVPIDLTTDVFSEKLGSYSNYDKNKKSFISLLGVSYYLKKNTFENLIKSISDSIPEGSTIVFDYPDENSYTEYASERAKKQFLLAKDADEEMYTSYSYADLEKILSGFGLLIYEHLEPEEITKRFIDEYNKANPSSTITAFDNVNYCLAVKK